MGLLVKDIRDHFFPNSIVSLSPLISWSTNVSSIKVDNSNNYVAKSYLVSKVNRKTLDIMRLWTKNVQEESEIIAPQFFPSINGDYFPLTHKGALTRISVAERLSLRPFEPKSLRDFRVIGKALGLLHKTAPKLHEDIPVFSFPKTNSEVELYRDILDPNEKKMLETILTFPIDLDKHKNQITHNDLHPANLLLSYSKFAFIDFDQLLIGPKANDIGQILSSFWIQNTPEEFEQAIYNFVDGYSLVNKLNKIEIASIPYFALRKICISFIWFKGISLRRSEALADHLYNLLKDRAQILFSYAYSKELI